MGYIDCDSHVVECNATWDYLDPSERHFRPRVFGARMSAEDSSPPQPTLRVNEDGTRPAMSVPGAFWVAGDTWSRAVRGDGDLWGNANLYSPGATQLTNLPERIADLDALGIDVQILISTLFIGLELDHPLEEAAITRSYNRWMGESLSDDRSGRLRWLARPPLRTLERAFEELEYAKEHGAVGIHLRGIEHGMYLSDPYFYPLYEKAQDLDLACVIHLGLATRRVDNLPFGQLVPRPEALMAHIHNAMAGFHAVLASDFWKRFPRLRWGIVEAGTTWIPTVLHAQPRLLASANEFLHMHRIASEELERSNLFVACESDEDLSYLTSVVGENVLTTGTDYGHNDLGSELGVHQVIEGRTDISTTAARKIVDDNGRKLYGIDPAFRPSKPLDRPIDDVPYVRGVDVNEGRVLVRATVD